MAERIIGRKAFTKAEAWRERIAEQEGSGLSVKQFCEQHGFTPWSFYDWRKRLRESGPVRFALVDRKAGRQEPAASADLEVMFATGERLRIRSGVDGATLRTVLRALRT
jgi:transposase-like protein